MLAQPARTASPLRLGRRSFATGEFAVMAIVNRTPDSFFDKGATFAADAALAAVDLAVTDGAEIIDIGGVKAGPGDNVDAAEELRRTIPTIEAVRARFPDVVISIDTWRAEVAREAVAAGADLLNDTWAGADPALAEVAAETGAAIVCSHAGGLSPRTRPHRIAFDDVVADVIGTVTALAERALSLGVRPDGILIDPAHDFGKNTRHSLALTRRLDELVATGWPVLVALSNKDFVGETLDVPLEERLNGTLAATAISAWLGARVFRAHQVRPTRQVLDMVASVRGDRPPAVARRGLAYQSGAADPPGWTTCVAGRKTDSSAERDRMASRGSHLTPGARLDVYVRRRLHDAHLSSREVSYGDQAGPPTGSRGDPLRW